MNIVEWAKLMAAIGALVVLCAPSAVAKKQKPIEAAPPDFKREEHLILNLSHSPNSAKFFLLQSLKQARETEHNLERSISQVEQADAGFNKARKHPDDRTMAGTTQRLKAALATTQQLEKDLQGAVDELKIDTQQTLIQVK